MHPYRTDSLPLNDTEEMANIDVGKMVVNIFVKGDVNQSFNFELDGHGPEGNAWKPRLDAPGRNFTGGNIETSIETASQKLGALLNQSRNSGYFPIPEYRGEFILIPTHNITKITYKLNKNIKSWRVPKGFAPKEF